jgi:hypothetical protein
MGYACGNQNKQTLTICQAVKRLQQSNLMAEGSGDHPLTIRVAQNSYAQSWVTGMQMQSAGPRALQSARDHIHVRQFW